jgi:hypothetical protein
MGDFFAFRMLITPRFIQVRFVIGLAGLVLVFIGAVSGDQALAGLLILIFGTLYWRILCELFFVLFRINDTLSSIKVDTRAMAGEGAASAVANGAGTPEPVSDPAQARAAATAPEGWYDDTERPGHKRWWDGTAWGARDDEQSRLDAPVLASAVVPAETEQEPPDTAITAEPSTADVSAPEPAPEPAAAPAVRYCENCGAERSPDARFCTSCGHA